MEIIVKREQKKTTFEKLSSGEVFRDSRGGFYIKTDCIDYNAVYLRSGSTVSFGDGDLVIKEKATLIIGGDEDENS